MITCFHKNELGISASVISLGEPIPQNTLWIDMLNSSLEEEISLKSRLGFAIPTHDEIWKNKVLNRLYKENDMYYMTAAIITKLQSPYPEISAVTFILNKDYLVTIRSISPTSFEQFIHRIKLHPSEFHSANAVLEGLLEEVLARVAHNAEVVMSDLDQLSHSIFENGTISPEQESKAPTNKNILKKLGCAADLNSKINESLHSIYRMLNFFSEVQGNDKEIKSGIHKLMTDVKVLMQQSSFLSDKITFQQDATLGMINVEQNTIIKIFSVVAVFFMPPTMIASIYGMNFQHMPELSWIRGYPMALTLMVLCAAIPFAYFKRKGWL